MKKPKPEPEHHDRLTEVEYTNDQANRDAKAAAWGTLAFLAAKLGFAAALGTLALLALADNPYDGDELIKGPITGIAAYGGGDLKAIYATLRSL